MSKKLFIYSLFILVFFAMACNDDKNKEAGFSGENILNRASINRDKNTRSTTLKIDIPGKWKLYAGESPDSISFTEPILKGDKRGEYKLNVSHDRRMYFELETQDGRAILSERLLPLAGAYNFRDLGGLQTQDGRYVKWGKIFRSDDLQKLTETDLEYLASIPLISVVDFRSNSEIRQAYDMIPETVKNTYALSISPGNLNDMSEDSIAEITAGQGDSIMREINKLLVTNPSCVEQYKKFFGLLQNEGSLPLVFHCTAGKDRTGLAAYLFLYSLGVDENTIMKDYMASNENLQEKYAPFVQRYPSLQPLMEVRPDYIQSAIDQIKKEHGSIDNYLKNELNVDKNKMREIYLY